MGIEPRLRMGRTLRTILFPRLSIATCFRGVRQRALPVVLALGACASAVTAQEQPPANGAVEPVRPSISEAVALYSGSYDGDSLVFVAGSAVHLQDWKLKPICRGDHGTVSVLGFLAIDTSGSAVGSNLTSVFFESVANSAQGWSATTWPGASPEAVVGHLKTRFGIPDDQDWLWEIPISAPNTPATSPVAAVFAFEDGFVSTDPLREGVAALPEVGRETLIQGLKQSGYMVADISIASLDAQSQHAFLDSAACYIASIAGTEGNPLLLALAQEESPNFEGDSPIQLDPVRFDPDFHVGGNPLTAPVYAIGCGVRLLHSVLAGCTAATILTGEWFPAEEPCNCTTVGPSPLGEFTGTVEAGGEAQFWIPQPLPRGTTIRIRVGVGLTFRTYVCLWTRTCVARTKRWVVKRHADCSVWAHPEYGVEATFTQVGWSLAARPEDCGASARPPEIPPSEQECGLTNPVAP